MSEGAPLEAVHETSPTAQPVTLPVSPDLGEIGAALWERRCFYSAPIGEDESPEREHSDLLLDSLIRPAIAALDPRLGVRRSDELPGSRITTEILMRVARSGLLIADLSFLKPNVFLEIGARLASGRPMVLVSREQDDIPFNVYDERVVRLKTATAHEFWKALPESREEITERARWALSPEGRAKAAAERELRGFGEAPA
jgi:hypothetical protein